MGCWGPGPFDNDDAADWLYELAECPDDGVLRNVFEPVLLGCADAIDSRLALAAAAVVAAWNNGRTDDLPEEVGEWIAPRGPLDPALAALAAQVLERLAATSELRYAAVSGDATSAEAWLATVRRLADELP